MVVRDKKGRPVLDVRPEELEVYEQGERQTVEGFKLVETGEPRAGARAASTPTQPDAARRINLVTIVFDALGVDGRRMAKRAAEAFVDKGLKPNTFISVFRVDQRLSMVAPFTNDKKLLEQAIDRATSGERFGVTDEREAMARPWSRCRDPRGPSGQEGQAPDTGGVGESAAAQAQARALANMLRLANELQAQQQGGTSLYPLLALVKGQQRPGRPQDPHLHHRVARRAPEPGGRLPVGDQRGQPLQRQRLRHRRPGPRHRARPWTEPATCWTGARHQPGDHGEPGRRAR